MSNMKTRRPAYRMIRSGFYGVVLVAMSWHVVHAKSPTLFEIQSRPDLHSTSAETFLRQIYVHFARQDRRDANVSTLVIAVAGPWQMASHHFTADTLAIINAHQALLTEVGVVDGDPFCGCQDWIDIEVDAVRTTPLTPTRADALVIFHDVDGRSKEITYRLLLTGEGWRVKDMTLLGTSPDGWLIEVLQAETAELRDRALSEWNLNPNNQLLQSTDRR